MSGTPKKIVKSPLSQSHSHSSDESDSDNENSSSLPNKLAALALIEPIKIDLTTLHPNSPEVISKQATINVGKLKKSFFI